MTAVVDRNRLLKSAAGFALAALAIYLFGRALGWEAVLGALGRADPIWIVAASASAACCLCVWTLSWRHVLSTVGVGIPWRSLVVDYFAATFVNYVTPLGRTSGAPVSAYILSTDHRAPYDESLATVATVTTLNVAPMLTFAGMGALSIARAGDVPGRMTPVLAGVGTLCVATPLATLGTWRAREHVADCISAVAGTLSERTGLIDPVKIDRRVRGFFTILDRVGRSRWELLEVLTLSYVGWVLFAAPLWLAAKALGVHLDPLLVAFVVPASTLASVVPTPGGIGGVETAIVLLLTGLGGIAAPTAGAIALLYRIAGYWFLVTLGGLAVLSVSTR
jgi:uncharacterized protein (TIRG00374 family)